RARRLRDRAGRRARRRSAAVDQGRRGRGGVADRRTGARGVGRWAGAPRRLRGGGRRSPRPDRGRWRMRLVTHGLLWLFLYLVLAVAPLFFAFAGDTPEGRGLWTELSVGLGFVGLAVL